MSVEKYFNILKTCDIPEIASHAVLYLHIKSGAQILSITNSDENKVFGISFRTPPYDSTGIAHILEHSVLCGSRKFPVKEPFVELLKGSLNTFLNAFTYPDKTCYPVASQNEEDFYNLVDVYLDAVFFPKISPYIFGQEGWHYEVDPEEQTLSYKGVVFNEMKGACSSPERLMGEYSLTSLFPDTAYGFDSGGDPEIIPSLTFEKFKLFHETFYHPSNARIYFYGNDNPERRLKILDEYLSKYNAAKINSAIDIQKPFKEPKYVEFPFTPGEAVDKGMITVNWVIGDTTDPVRSLSVSMLNFILLGMPGSPLRKALIDSGLGDDLTGGGLEGELCQSCFSVGLKGVPVIKLNQVETVILAALKSIADGGIARETIEAAVNTIEFSLRENNTGRFPRGLSLMLRSLTSWLYDKDPFTPLAFEKPLEITKNLAFKPGYFEDLIYNLFINNTHRSTVKLVPDSNLADKLTSREQAALESAKSSMDKTELTDISNFADILKKQQETPDSPEALATIPRLSLKDIPRENKEIISIDKKHNNYIMFGNNLFTNKIAYMDIGFDLHSLPEKFLPLVSLFGRALLEMGTKKEDFVSLSQRIRRVTGGISTQKHISARLNSPDITAVFFIHSKTVINRLPDLTDLLNDILSMPNFDNKERFRQMALEEKAGIEHQLIPSGHGFVGARLRANFSMSGWLSELTGGVSYLFYLRELLDTIDTKWHMVLEQLEEMRSLILLRKNAIVNYTLPEANWPEIENAADSILSNIPDREPDYAPQWGYGNIALDEALIVPSQINYIGKGANLYNTDYKFHGSALAITKYIRNSFLWDRVRVQGGAYGAFCQFDRLSGTLVFISYRDPNTIKTIKAFDDSMDFLINGKISEQEIEQTIIGAIGEIDHYMLPDAKGFSSLIRYLAGITPEHRQLLRNEVLSTTREHFREFGNALKEVRDNGLIKILCSKNTFEQFNMPEGKKLSPLVVL